MLMMMIRSTGKVYHRSDVVVQNIN